MQENDDNLNFSFSFEHVFLTIGVGDKSKGLASQCKAQEKYKEHLDLGVTWLNGLPTDMESKTRLAPKSNKVNSQKLTLD